LTGGIDANISSKEVLERFGLQLPPKPFELFDDVFSGRIKRAVVAAGRGCGKSWTAAGIETAMFAYKGYDWFNIGGSKTQAKKVYDKMQDFINYDYRITKNIIKSIQSETKHKDGQFIAVAAASSTQIRSQHFGSKNRGGGLTIDEEDDADENIIKAALPTVNTAHPSVIIRMSTQQKRVSTFQFVYKNAGRLGYKSYHWDVFDVCDRCTDKCKNCIKEFREKYCKGKAKSNKYGWITVAEIKQMWRESDENKEWFEVEFMGWEAKKGLFVYDKESIEKCVVPVTTYYAGNPTFLGIDWGWVKDRCVFLVMQMQGKNRIILKTKALTRPSMQVVFHTVQELYNQYKFDVILPDSSHTFENNELAIKHWKVSPVVFAKEKETGISNVNNGFERGLYRIPANESKLIDQLINYRYDKNGKPIKKDDHYCDALLCASEPCKPKIKDISEVNEDDEIVEIIEIPREVI